MREKLLIVLICGFLLTSSASGSLVTQINYAVADLGSDRWQYTYDVTNISLEEEIEEFTIWFGLGSYGNLAIETLDPPAGNWDEIVWQPEEGLGDGGYDAVAKDLNIGVGETVSGFAVSFDWLGTGVPGSQFYEIINPVDFTTIDSGFTVPEPATVVLLCFGGLVVLRKQRKIVR